MTIRLILLAVLLPVVTAGTALGQKKRGERNKDLVVQADLKRIYFDLYTDSIKPVLNYYVNVVGELKEGGYLPLDSSHIILTCDQGRMSGNEWVLPEHIGFDKVTFTATARSNSSLTESVTVYIKKGRDPRDETSYGEEEKRKRR